MNGAESCTAWTLRHSDGAMFTLVRFGDETDWTQDAPATNRCHDCDVLPGGFHHPGCDSQECPRCGRQLIFCGCFEDEDIVPPSKGSSG